MRLHRVSTYMQLGAVALTAIGAAATPAMAQSVAPDGLALNRFDPAPAGDRMFGVPSPYSAGDPDLHLMVLADYAHEPLVVRTSDGQELGAVVGDQLFLHINGTIAFWHRLSLNVELPVALVQDGDSPTTATGQTFVSPSAAALGDLRVGLRLSLLGSYEDAFQLALGGYLWVPTGEADSFTSDESVRALPQLILGGRGDRFVWSLAVGPELRHTQTYGGVEQGTMFKTGAGIALLAGENRQFQIGPEVTTAVVLGDANRRNTNVEALLGARYRLGDVELGLGAGPGLSSGAGTPELRGVAMIAYTPDQMKKQPTDRDRDGILDPVDACPDEPGLPSADPKKHGCPPSDRDKDGVLDEVDACPDEPGLPNADPKKHGCPPSDRDKDGILDEVDACPDVPGIGSEDPKKHGCPPPADRDGDGIFDEQDACPDLKGIPTNDPATNGCPGDLDGDGIRDDKDACPREKGPADPDPANNGCPKLVRVTEKEIRILQQIQFDFDKSSIKAVSDELLNQVAAVIREHGEIVRIELQGHTDSVASDTYNKALSQRRADAVKKALVARGISADRLTATGYGEERPIATNDTDEGRQINRRTQFMIMQVQKPAESK